MESSDNGQSLMSAGKRKAEQDCDVNGTLELSQLTSTSNNTTSVTSKRQDIINWDEYFMSIAFLSSLRSKDPNTQVGACIVNPEKKIVAIGYNGFPRGCSDDELPWDRNAESKYDTKYMVSLIQFKIIFLIKRIQL